MEARKVQIDTLFEPRVQYRIPLFQRHYVWDEKNQWIPLWKDILNNYEQSISQTQGKSLIHFTGAIVIQQQQEGMFAAVDVPIYDIIDGQQRLTTFQIILCAIRDICESNGHDNIASDVNLYIFNQGNLLGVDEQYKLIPTVYDRGSFLSLIDKHVDENQGRIQEAYRYFKDTIADEVKGDSEKIYTLFRCIRKNVGFVQIIIDDDDHPERIFETLNARGKNLLHFDLLRNNLFLRAREGENRDSLYDTYWVHFEDAYWDPEVKNVGTSYEHFLQHFLMSKLGKSGVTPEFNVYCDEYSGKLEASLGIEYELSELKKYSITYQEMTDCQDNSEIGHRMKFYDTFNLTVLHPFTLFIKQEVKLSGDELSRVFNILESYTLRRMLCYGGTRALLTFPRFFSQLISRLRNKFTLQGFIEMLSSECSDSLKYPTDDEIQSALHTHYEDHFSDDSGILFPNNVTVRAALEGLWVNTAGRVHKKLIRYILFRIEQMKEKEDQYTEPLDFKNNLTTLEHILPQAWKAKWKLPISEGAIIYDESGGNYPVSVNREGEHKTLLYVDMFSDESETRLSREGLVDPSYSDAYNLALARDQLLESIGNLTLVKSNLNAKLGNRIFPEKRKVLGDHSRLKLNTEICEHDTWDVNEIHARANRLIADVCKIWPSLDVFREENS